MAQHDYVIANGTGAAVRSDLNNALAAIVSQNSGATEPATMYAYQFWADTTTGLLKLRNAANNAWITLRQLDGDFDTVPVENGTASAPSIYFRASGTDTGFYSSGTDALDFTTAGTRRLGISSSGDITVYGGNTTLNAQGDLRFADSDSSNWVAFQGPATVSSNVTWTLPSADGTSGQVLSTNGSGTLSWATASGTSDKISEGNTEAEVVDTGVDGHFKVTTEGTERLRVTAAGLVGIGTNSPLAKLVVSNGGADGYEVNPGSGGVELISYNRSSSAYGSTTYDSSAHAFRISGTERARIDSSGRLLVGTSSVRSNIYKDAFTNIPTAQFETATNTYNNGLSLLNYSANGYGPVLSLGTSFSNTPGTNTLLDNGGDMGWINFTGNDGTNFRTGASIGALVDGASGSGDMPGRLIFSTTADGASSPTERMRISQAGVGSLVSTIDGFYISSVQGAGTAYRFLECRYGGTAGTAYSGTTSFQVYTNGNVQNTNNSYAGISDAKLKENIVDAGSQWNDLKAFQVRKFNFKEGQTHTQIGLIAQEVELVSPGLVTESPDRDADGNDLGTVTKSVNYSVLYMKAVKALQEAMERIEQLETEMAEVKAQLQAS
jgi:hypothetical protein